MKFSRIIFLLAAAGGGYLLYRKMKAQNSELHLYGPFERLHHESAQSVPDERGNYDIDGVSIDRKGIMIGSDAHHVTSTKQPPLEEMH